ncbi:MAG: NAD(P)-dependent oxidoreductase [Rhizobiaceae bacterium]
MSEQRPRVLYLSHVPNDMKAVILPLFCGFADIAFLDRDDDRERMDRIGSADVVVVAASKLTAPMIARAPSLRLVHHHGVGYHDTVDVDALRRARLPLAITRAGTTSVVAEHVVMLTLAVLRRLTLLDVSVRAGDWHVNAFRAQSRSLEGMTIGYLGMGEIGQATAKLFRPFGTTGIYYNRSGPLPAGATSALGLTHAPLDDVISLADVLTLHLPLTAETHGLINATRLERMRPGSVLINTARGKLVDSEALADVLTRGHLAGAGLDVLDREPPSLPSTLLQSPNLIVTPHVAAATLDALRQKTEFIAANIRRFWLSGRVENAIAF